MNVKHDKFLKQMECYTLMLCKRWVSWFYNETTSDLTLLVDFYGCYMQTWSENLKIWVQNYLFYYWGHFGQAAGDICDNVFNPVQK